MISKSGIGPVADNPLKRSYLSLLSVKKSGEKILNEGLFLYARSVSMTVS